MEQTTNPPPRMTESPAARSRPRFPWLAKLRQPLLALLGLVAVLAVILGWKHLRSGDEVDGYFNRGSEKFQKEDYDGAIADFSKVIELNAPPAKRCLAYNNRGSAKGRKKQPDLDGAIADFNEALKINPDLADAYNNRGVAYRDRFEFDKAIADFDTAIKLKPSESDYYSHRALAKYKRERRGDLPNAFADCDQALRVNSRNPEAYKIRGLVKVRYNKIAWADEDFNRYRELKPNPNDWSKLEDLWQEALERPRLDPKELGVE